jgi:hypothetical protein
VALARLVTGNQTSQLLQKMSGGLIVGSLAIHGLSSLTSLHKRYSANGQTLGERPYGAVVCLGLLNTIGPKHRRDKRANYRVSHGEIAAQTIWASSADMADRSIFGDTSIPVSTVSATRRLLF